jgi:hypothetical protein
MWSAATTCFARSHLPHFSPVDIVCTMGTVSRNTPSISTTFQSSHTGEFARGLFCAQLLTRVFDTLTESTVP